MSDTRRIARNTLMLYFRQILIMLVSLYTVRVVLNVLGAEDYGIYNVVAGVVTMFGFLSGAMATASQRYFSYDLGKNDEEHLKTTFSVTFQIYVLLSLLVFLLAETLGLWFVNNKLVIPQERMTAANWIFQAAVISFLLTLITTPYMAAIIAHENMNVYAYVSIVEAALKLGIVFLLCVLSYDKLIVYGALLALVALVNTSIYRFYCRKHYAECRFTFVKDGKLFREIISYSGWNLFGASVGIVKNQILNILLNIHYGAVVNAARGIAVQVNSAVISFGQNFSKALDPQVIKMYASKEKSECEIVVCRAGKLTFFLMWIFMLPLILEMDFVLGIWLKNPPANAVIFTRLILIDSLIEAVSYQVMTLAQATGKIKLYQGVVSGILLLNFPISYFVLSFGYPSWCVFIVSIVITIISSLVRLFIVHNLTVFSVKKFLCSVILSCILIVISSLIIPCTIVHFLSDGWSRFFLVSVSSVLLVGIFSFAIGLNKAERNFVLITIKDKVWRGKVND